MHSFGGGQPSPWRAIYPSRLRLRHLYILCYYGKYTSQNKLMSSIYLFILKTRLSRRLGSGDYQCLQASFPFFSIFVLLGAHHGWIMEKKRNTTNL